MKAAVKDESSDALQVGVFEAKTHFAKLPPQARSGKCIVINQRGKPVAELGPMTHEDTTGNSLRGDTEGKIRMSDDFCRLFQ